MALHQVERTPCSPWRQRQIESCNRRGGFEGEWAREGPLYKTNEFDGNVNAGILIFTHEKNSKAILSCPNFTYGATIEAICFKFFGIS